MYHSGIWLLSVFGLIQSDTALATVSSSLGLFGVWDIPGLVVVGGRDGK